MSFRLALWLHLVFVPCFVFPGVLNCFIFDLKYSILSSCHYFHHPPPWTLLGILSHCPFPAPVSTSTLLWTPQCDLNILYGVCEKAVLGQTPPPTAVPGWSHCFQDRMSPSFLMTFSLNIKLLYKLLWSCVNHCDLRQSIHLLSWSFPSVNDVWLGLSWVSLGISSFCESSFSKPVILAIFVHFFSYGNFRIIFYYVPLADIRYIIIISFWCVLLDDLRSAKKPVGLSVRIKQIPLKSSQHSPCVKQLTGAKGAKWGGRRALCPRGLQYNQSRLSSAWSVWPRVASHPGNVCVCLPSLNVSMSSFWCGLPFVFNVLWKFAKYL